MPEQIHPTTKMLEVQWYVMRWYPKLTASIRRLHSKAKETAKRAFRNSLNDLNNKGALIGRRIGREDKVEEKIITRLESTPTINLSAPLPSFTGIGSREILTSI